MGNSRVTPIVGLLRIDAKLRAKNKMIPMSVNQLLNASVAIVVIGSAKFCGLVACLQQSMCVMSQNEIQHIKLLGVINTF